ncbi:MAG: hypothetical protein ACRDDI_09445, partial [Aeromonas veronii]
MFTPTVLILMAIIFVLLMLNGKVHLDLKRAREEAARWKTRGDTLNSDLTVLQQRGMDFDRDLKRQQRAYDAEIQHLRQRLRAATVEIEGLRTKQSALTSIKFHARVPTYSGFQKTEFKLGLGPCGLTVESLHCEEQADKFILTQI